MQIASYVEILFCSLLIVWAGALAIHKMNRPQGVLFPDVVFFMSVLYFALGPIVSHLLGYGRTFESTWSVGEICLGYIAVIVFLLSLLIGSKLFRPRSLFRPEFTSYGRRSPLFFFVGALNEVKFSYVMASFLLVWALRFIHFKYGGGFSGSETMEVMLSIPYPIVILRQVFGLLYIVVVIYAVLQLMRSTRKNYLYILLLLPEVVFHALQGRRDLVFMILLIGFVYYALRMRINWKIVFGSALGLLLIFTVYSKVFLQFRTAATADRSSIYAGSFFDTLKIGLEQATIADDGLSSARLNRNLVYRSRMNTDWILTITSGIGPLGDLHGASFIHAVFSALPRALRPVKYWGDHASIIQAHLGVRDFDAADNYVANGYVDFGFLGVALLGVGVAALLNFGLVCAQILHRQNVLLGSLVFAMLFYLAINVEVSLNRPLLVSRNIAVLVILSLVVSSIGIDCRRSGRHIIAK